MSLFARPCGRVALVARLQLVIRALVDVLIGEAARQWQILLRSLRAILRRVIVFSAALVVIELGLRAGGCLLYTSDAADDGESVDLGGRRIIKKKK